MTAPLVAIIDCEVCAGTGVMTAREVEAATDAPPAVIPCPACAGAGAFIPTRPAAAVRQ